MIFVIGFSFILILILVEFLWKSRLIFATKNFDGPFYLPIIGNAVILYTKQDDLLQTLYESFLKYKSPVKVWLGPKLLIGSTNMDDIEKILTLSKLANKSDLIYDGMKHYLGEGLKTVSRPKHKRLRRAIQPLVNLKFCSDITPILQENIRICMRKLENYNNCTFDIRKVSHKCFVDCVGEFIMGTKINAQNGENEKFVESASRMFYFFINKLLRPWLKINFIYKFTKEYKKDMDIFKEVRMFAEKVVRESEKRIKSDKTYSETTVVPIIDEILNQVENDPNICSKTEIIDHILTLYAASEDTLSNISSFAAICFGIYPQYQQRAYNEIREIIGDEIPENITISDLNKLTYLDRCLKDVLRLFPIAPYIARNVEEDLELDSIKIPQGVGFVIPIFNLHYSPKYWEKPNEFNPDHFLEEAVKKRQVYSYIPFSAGTRGCIGKTLAILTLKLYLCHLLLEYEISTDLNKIEDIKLKMDIILRSAIGYNVKLKKRYHHKINK